MVAFGFPFERFQDYNFQLKTYENIGAYRLILNLWRIKPTWLLSFSRQLSVRRETYDSVGRISSTVLDSTSMTLFYSDSQLGKCKG